MITALTMTGGFQYMLLLRGATRTLFSFGWMLNVSIHAPLARSNPDVVFIRLDVERFNTCSSCEEQLTSTKLSAGQRRFNTCSSCEEQPTRPHSAPVLRVSIHAPLARSNLNRWRYPMRFNVSIHAPLARSNCLSQTDNEAHQSFNTCSSCEEQRSLPQIRPVFQRFNTCSSCEEQLMRFFSFIALATVSIHAPLARSNFLMRTSPSISKVSIHAPLARSNKSGESVGAGGKKFQYMLLLRGATLPNDSVRPVSRFNTCSSCEEQQGVGRGNRPRLVSIPAPLARSNL